MSSREANIEQLNRAINSLNDDAESVHELMARSADELESATNACNRAADNAAQIIEALGPLTELLDTQHRNSAAMLEEARMASEEQRTTATEQTEALKSTVIETLDSLSSKTETTCNGLVKTVEDTFGELEKSQDEAFNVIRTKTLKEHERTRDELQTDILGFKNATSARLDALEAGITKVESAVKELEGKVAESTDSTTKKLLIPMYVAIGVGVINLICLAMLLMR